MTRTDCRWNCMSKMKKTRKPGGGRKKLNPEYDAGKNLKEQMDSAVALYDSEMSLQAIGDELGNRDHSTIVYAIGQVESRMKEDTHFKETVEDIVKNIRDS